MAHRRTIYLGATAIAVAACACGPSRESFEPAERATAQAPNGFTAAEYAIQGTRGDLADAKVWSRGAYRAELDGRMQTIVHVGFELENNGNAPLTLRRESLSLDSATLDRRVLQDIYPASIVGDLTIPPGNRGEVHAYFAMPEGVKPTDVDAFRVKWRVEDGQVSYSQRTPFVEITRDERVAYYYTPFYDPFYYDYLFGHPRIIVHNYPYRHLHVFR